jgi:hypothetical protein
VKEKRMNELGLLFWDLDEQVLKDMENVIRVWVLYFEYENTPRPLSRGEKYKKEVY